MSQFPGQQNLSGTQTPSSGTPSSSRYPNSALRRQGMASSSSLNPITPSRPGGGASLQPSPLSHHEVAETTLNLTGMTMVDATPSRRPSNTTSGSSLPQEWALSAPELTARSLSHGDLAEELNDVREKLQSLGEKYKALRHDHHKKTAERDESRRDRNIQSNLRKSLEAEVTKLKQETHGLVDEKEKLKGDQKGLEEALRQSQLSLQRAQRTVKQQADTIRTQMRSVPSASAHVTTQANTSIAQPSPNHQRGQQYSQRVPTVSDDVRNYPNFRPSASSMQTEESQTNINWAADFAGHFKTVERFCQEFLNAPNPTVDRAWLSRMASNIAAETSINHVQSLMDHVKTRPLLLTRLVLGWVIDQTFSTRCIKGFDKVSDHKVLGLRTQIRPEMATELRRGLKQAETDVVREVIKKEGYESWKAKQAQSFADTVMPRLRDIVSPDSNHNDARSRLETIILDAYRIGASMASQSLTWSVLFPATTNTSYYTPTTMLNRDLWITGPPHQLEAQRARVALGITPHITAVDYMEEGGARKTMHLANVLLRL